MSDEGPDLASPRLLITHHASLVTVSDSVGTVKSVVPPGADEAAGDGDGKVTENRSDSVTGDQNEETARTEAGASRTKGKVASGNAEEDRCREGSASLL